MRMAHGLLSAPVDQWCCVGLGEGDAQMHKTRYLALTTVALRAFFLAGCVLPPVRTIQVSDGRQHDPNAAQRRTNPSANEPSDFSDPNSSIHWIQISPTNDTLLKAEKADSTTLTTAQKCPLPRGTRHALARAPEWLGSHARIELRKKMVGCELSGGWIFAQHIASSSDSQLGPVQQVYTTTLTLYTTENTAMEGGPKDRCGRPLRTLDDYLKGNADYVSVAMDSMALPYGTVLRIPEIENRFRVSEAIPFKVVDTGSAFMGRGTSRMDICVGHNQQTIFSDTYLWLSHKSLDFQVIQNGTSFDCQ